MRGNAKNKIYLLMIIILDFCFRMFTNEYKREVSVAPDETADAETGEKSKKRLDFLTRSNL